MYQSLNNPVFSIEFKAASEGNDKFAFLDVFINGEISGDISFTVHRRLTHVNLYIHFYSYHHSSTKMPVSSMFQGALRFCSLHLLDEEQNKIRAIFSNLKYLIWFISFATLVGRRLCFGPRVFIYLLVCMYVF